LAAIEYLAGLGRTISPGAANRRDALECTMAAIRTYEAKLVARLLAGLAEQPAIRVWGITDPARYGERLPTVALTHKKLTALEIAKRLGERGIFVWHGNFYALELSETLGLEPHGMVRIGLVHYNTAEEVDRLLRALREIE
jgi:selenocysteine lyase/cysteine desulfurase